MDQTGAIIRVTHTADTAESWGSVPTGNGVWFTSNRDGKRKIYQLDQTGAIIRVTYTVSNAESYLYLAED